MKKLYGGIEAGGTKFCCAVGNNSGTILHRIIIPTTTPDETLTKVIAFFHEIHTKTPLSAFGIGAFGPVDLDIKSPTYGYITTPPKLAWQNYNILGAIKNAFALPVGFDTDVNSSALGEYYLGAAKGLDTFLYITVGTGIGGGGMIGGKLMHGLIHPEMGHIFIPHDKIRDPYPGNCPFHGDCLEGLAAGPAMQKRWDVKSAMDLAKDHPSWELEADYLSYALANYILAFSPQKIIVGGGVNKNTELLSKIRPKVQKLLNGYIKHPLIIDNIDEYIVAPQLGHDAGIHGTLALAAKATKININQIGKVYERPWGSYQTLVLAENYQIKTITVNPKGRLSLQKHVHRSEHWLVVSGALLITVGKETKNYTVGEKIFIDKEVVHRAENTTDQPATIIEAQLGSYLGEDDIVRLEDIYGRI